MNEALEVLEANGYKVQRHPQEDGGEIWDAFEPNFPAPGTNMTRSRFLPDTRIDELVASGELPPLLVPTVETCFSAWCRAVAESVSLLPKTA